MSSSLDTIRYHSGIAGEEVADMVDSLEREVSALREQVAHLSLYKPARRTEQKQEPVKAIGPCDEGFWRLKHETDADFARWGNPHTERVE